MAAFASKGEPLQIVDFRNERLAYNQEIVLNWRQFIDGYRNGKAKS